MARIKYYDSTTQTWKYGDLAVQNPLPSGTNTGDIPVWNGSAWVAQQPSRLPAGYQEVEWIESTGDAYIDTGYVPNTNTVWRLITKFYGTGDSSNTMRHGRHGGGTGERFSIGAQAMVTYNYMELAIGNFNLRRSMWGDSLLYHTKMDVLLDASTKLAEINNCYYYEDYSGATLTFANNDSLYLFRRHLTGGSYDGNGTSRVYYHLIIEGNAKIQEFIPCYRIADGVIGMYDLVTDTFFTNAGTGTFTKGVDV